MLNPSEINRNRRSTKQSRRAFETLERRELLCGSSLASDAGNTCDDTVEITSSFVSRSSDLLRHDVQAASEPVGTLDLNGDGKIGGADAAFLCDAMVDPSIRAQVLIGDANLSGGVGFDDFLLMVTNFSEAGHFGNGDFDCSGTTDFSDFLLLSSDFGKKADYVLPPDVVDPIEPPNGVPCDESNVECITPGQESYFQEVMSTPSDNPKIFYVLPDVELDGLHIQGRHGDAIHFLPGSEVVGTVQARGPWNADRGVVNIEASSNLLITGLNATNEYQYQIENHGEDRQSSTALNISWSHDIELQDSVLKGKGKLTTWIQGDSIVEMTNTEVDCYYFCVGIAASDVTSRDLVINQNNEIYRRDTHAAIWISSTMRAPDNTFYGNSSVSFADTTINKQTGEAIIMGNGGYDYRSNVELTGQTAVHASGIAATRKDGWLAVHPNYFGISLYLEDDYPTTRADFAKHAASGEFGRFVMHAFNGTGHGPFESPLIVCNGGCVSTNDLFR